MKYVVEGNGDHWTASNGSKSAEGETPDDALIALVLGECEEEHGSGDFDAGPSSMRKTLASDEVGRHCLCLIRLLVLNAPPVIVRNEVQVISRFVEAWLVEADVDDESEEL